MELVKKMREVFPKYLVWNEVCFICIGTDRSTGDLLGPLVGTYLTQRGYKNVFGAIDNPVHAMNLADTIEKLPKDKVIIAIDASLGNRENIGKINVRKGFLEAGTGVGKRLPLVGDYSITGVVNVGGFMGCLVLQSTRLSVVMKMANEIVEALCEVFPLKERQQFIQGY